MNDEPKPAPQKVNRLSFNPAHNFREVDVNAWAHQWFDALAYMDTRSEEYKTIERMVANQLATCPDDRTADKGDLQYYMGHLRLVGQQNPHDPKAESVDERREHMSWEQRMMTAMIDARQIVRRTLAEADSYVASRIDQENAGIDYLTGALNRRGLTQRLNDQYRITDNPERRDAAGNPLPPLKLTHVYVDVNDFKQINDILGHYVGDMALYELAKKIQELFRSADVPIIYRPGGEGGDEFGIILGNLTDEEADALTGRLIRLQLDKIHSGQYRQAMLSLSQKIEAVKRSGQTVRVEVRRNGTAEPDTLNDMPISHTIYINGEAVAKLYDIVTLSVGVKSGFVNNLKDVERSRSSAEEAMWGAKSVFRSIADDFLITPPDAS